MQSVRVATTNVPYQNTGTIQMSQGKSTPAGKLSKNQETSLLPPNTAHLGIS